MKFQDVVAAQEAKPALGAAIFAGLTTYAMLAKRRQREHIGKASAGQVGDARGRAATSPGEIPRRGWWDIAMRTKDDVSRNNLSLIAAGAAFYAFLAIPSAITALVSLYGLVFDPRGVQRQVEAMRGLLPDEAIRLISDQLQTLASHSNSTLGAGLVISLALALWSARSGISSMITALNIVYGEAEKRGYLRLQVVALGLTAGAVLSALVALALIAILPAVLSIAPVGGAGKTIAALVRWPILIALVTAALAAIYRFAPSREEPKWRWVSWGAVAATILWIIASALFSIYVGRFATYDKSYGSLGAVVVLLMWLYLSAFVVLFGAQLNAEIEHQTARDSTTGSWRPLGQRGALMADTVGSQTK